MKNRTSKFLYYGSFVFIYPAIKNKKWKKILKEEVVNLKLMKKHLLELSDEWQKILKKIYKRRLSKFNKRQADYFKETITMEIKLDNLENSLNNLDVFTKNMIYDKNFSKELTEELINAATSIDQEINLSQVNYMLKYNNLTSAYAKWPKKYLLIIYRVNELEIK